MFTLGTEIGTDKKFYLPQSDRTLSTAIFGGTGMGKSSLIERLARCDIEDKTASIVFDVKGTLSQRLLAYSTAKEDSRVRMVWVSTKSFTFPFGLNIYECKYLNNSSHVDRTVSNILSLFQKFWTGEFGPLIQQGLRATALTLIYGNGAMNDIPLLYESKQFRERMLQSVPRENVKRYWRTYENLPLREQHIWSGPILNKIDQLLSYEVVERVVSQTHTTVDWKQLTDEGYTILLRFPPGEIGEDPASLLGTMCLSQIAEMIYQRSTIRNRPRLHLYIDEYGRYATQQTSFLLKEGREYNVGTTIATQTLSDLGEDEQVSAALQVGTKIFYNLVGEPDARMLVSNLKGIAPEPRKRGRTVPESVEEMTPYIHKDMQWVPPESDKICSEMSDRWLQATREYDGIHDKYTKANTAYQQLLDSIYGWWYFPSPGADNGWIYTRRFYEEWELAKRLEEMKQGDITPIGLKDDPGKAIGHHYIKQWLERTNRSFASLSDEEEQLRKAYIYWNSKEQEARKTWEQAYQAMDSYRKAHYIEVSIPKQAGTGKFHTVYHEVEEEEPPTIAEIRDNTVSILATFPKYHAYVRLVSGQEGILSMPAPEQFTPGPIPQQQYFGRAWKKVQEEIAARQSTPPVFTGEWDMMEGEQKDKIQHKTRRPFPRMQPPDEVM